MTWGDRGKNRDNDCMFTFVKGFSRKDLGSSVIKTNNCQKGYDGCTWLSI